MAKNKKDPRDRATFQLQLDITRTSDRRDDNLSLLDYLDSKKRKREAKKTVRNALMLYENLEHGETEQLLKQFPEIYQVIRDQIIKDLLGDMSAMNFSGKGRVRGNQEDDIDIEFEIKRDTTTDSGLNFLKSAMGATGNFIPIDNSKKKEAPKQEGSPKQITVPKFDTPTFDDEDDLDLFK